jgi:hypothetical protein
VRCVAAEGERDALRSQLPSAQVTRTCLVQSSVLISSWLHFIFQASLTQEAPVLDELALLRAQLLAALQK